MPHDHPEVGSPVDWMRHAKGDYEPVSEDEYHRALSLAKDVYRWVQQLIS